MRVMAASQKYLAIFQTQIKNLLEYRTNILLKLIRPFIMTAAVASLWMVLFEVSGKENIGGFTRRSFIVYLLTIRFIAVFSPGGASIREMNEEICTGNLTMRLVRPMHYLAWLFARNIPVPLVSGLIGLGLVSMVTFIISGPAPSGWFIPLFAFSVLATILLQYAVFQGIGVLSFWIYEVFPIERFYRSISNLLSGELIPLTIFPPAMASIVQYLPFASMAFIPGGIFTGLFTLKQAAIFVIIQYVWVLILWSILIFAYNKGLKKFEAQGG